ncbi:MAG: hypothetical protein ABIH87_02510 [bacterium]
MAYFHKDLTQEKWNNLPRTQQVLNIASELTRAKNWQEKKDRDYMLESMNRVLELLDLTGQDKKWQSGSLRELRRLREQLGLIYLENTEFKIGDYLKVLLTFDKQSALVQI